MKISILVVQEDGNGRHLADGSLRMRIGMKRVDLSLNSREFTVIASMAVGEKPCMIPSSVGCNGRDH